MVASRREHALVTTRMRASKELILALIAAMARQSVEQATSPLSTKYEAVAVVASSFSSIRTTSLGVQGWVVVCSLCY